MTSPEADKAARLEAVVALIEVRSQKSDRASLTTFARAYFERVDPEDITVRSVEDLFGALLSHWQFARKREAGAIKVRVFNPEAGEHGWASRHTVVEIVNDDMPFLVDSASMEVNRQGLALHLIVHPIFAVERDKSGTLQTIDLRSKQPDWPRESFMHIEVDRLADPTARAELAAGIERHTCTADGLGELSQQGRVLFINSCEFRRFRCRTVDGNHFPIDAFELAAWRDVEIDAAEFTGVGSHLENRRVACM